MNKIPDKEGWFWAKGRLGWTCVKVRQLDGVWVGLNPYDGKEHPLHFPDDQFWDGIKWHGEAPPPDSLATLRDALLALVVSDRNASRMSDEEVLGVIVSNEAKQVPILLERANAVWKARSALRAANDWLNVALPPPCCSISCDPLDGGKPTPCQDAITHTWIQSGAQSPLCTKHASRLAKLGEEVLEVEIKKLCKWPHNFPCLAHRGVLNGQLLACEVCAPNLEKVRQSMHCHNTDYTTKG